MVVLKNDVESYRSLTLARIQDVDVLDFLNFILLLRVSYIRKKRRARVLLETMFERKKNELIQFHSNFIKLHIGRDASRFMHGLIEEFTFLFLSMFV
jgi:hypothetical protein